MRIQRTPHESGFVIIPNGIAQSDELSLTEIGLLVRLLSQRDGTPETVRGLTEHVAEGQSRVTKAMKGLQAAGYVVCTKVQNEAGHWSTHVTVSDVPMSEAPKIEPPKSGGLKCRIFGANPSGKNQEKNLPPTPEAKPEDMPAAEPQGGREEAPQSNDKATGEAVAILNRIGQAERRLRLGVPEMLKLAPLAVEWLNRGATERDIKAALVSGLPAEMRSAVSVVEWRLKNKLPAVSEPLAPVVPLADCGQCRGPLPRGQVTGICDRCAGVAQVTPAAPEDSTRTISGEAMNLLSAIRDRRATGAYAPKARPFRPMSA